MFAQNYPSAPVVPLIDLIGVKSLAMNFTGVMREKTSMGNALLRVGSNLWVPCSVGPGPFSNERFVIVRDEDNEWGGFVDIQRLRLDEDETTGKVLAEVVEIDGDSFSAHIIGHAVRSGFFRGKVDRVSPYDPVET